MRGEPCADLPLCSRTTICSGRAAAHPQFLPGMRENLRAVCILPRPSALKSRRAGSHPGWPVQAGADSQGRLRCREFRRLAAVPGIDQKPRANAADFGFARDFALMQAVAIARQSRRAGTDLRLVAWDRRSVVRVWKPCSRFRLAYVLGIGGKLRASVPSRTVRSTLASRRQPCLIQREPRAKLHSAQFGTAVVRQR